MRCSKVFIGSWVSCCCCQWGAIWPIASRHSNMAWIICMCSRLVLWKRIFSSCSWRSWIYTTTHTIAQELVDRRWRNKKWREIVTIWNVAPRIMRKMQTGWWPKDRKWLLSYSHWVLQNSSIVYNWCRSSSRQNQWAALELECADEQVFINLLSLSNHSTCKTVDKKMVFACKGSPFHKIITLNGITNFPRYILVNDSKIHLTLFQFYFFELPKMTFS